MSAIPAKPVTPSCSCSTAAPRSAVRSGRRRCSAASNSGTRIMAVFSSAETTDVSAVRREIPRSFREKSTPSSRKASRKRTASRLNVSRSARHHFAKINDVARAVITAASRISACFFHHQALLHRIAGVVYPRFPVPETEGSSISVPDFFYISRSREKTPAGQAAPQVSVRPAA